MIAEGLSAASRADASDTGLLCYVESDGERGRQQEPENKQRLSDFQP